MKNWLFGILLFCYSFAWVGDFAISCGNNGWPDPTGIAALDAGWKFGGAGNDAAAGSVNKVLTLTCVASPSAAGEISAGNFFFRLIHLEGTAWYSWGGDAAGGLDEEVVLNNFSESLINGNAYQNSKAAYFTATEGKTYQILFQANPGGGAGTSTVSVLEFDGSTATIDHSTSGADSPLHQVTDTEIIFEIDCGTTQPPADQQYYVRTYFSDGYTGAYDSWANALISGVTSGPTLGYNNHYWAYINISKPSDGTTMNYYTMTTESTNTPTNSNIDPGTLWLDNNSGLNYSESYAALSTDDAVQIPERIKLNSVYPNPFNPVTTISYSVDHVTEMNIQVYDLLGNSVISLFQGTVLPGEHELQWDASGFKSGVYLIRLNGGGETYSEKITLMK